MVWYTDLTKRASGTDQGLPEGEVVDVVELGLSDWCETHRIDLKRPNGHIQHFFTKVS